MGWEELIQEAKDNGYSSVILPTDEYEAEVVKAEFKQQSGKKDRLQVKWKVLSGPQADETVMEYISIDLSNPKLMGVVLSKLHGAGITDDFLSSLKDRFGPLDSAIADHFKAVAAQLQGNQSVIKVTATEYQGKPKNEVWAQHPLTASPAPVPTGNGPERNPYSAPVNPEMPI